MIFSKNSSISTFLFLTSILNVSLCCFSGCSSGSGSGGSRSLNTAVCGSTRQLNGSSSSKIVGGTEAPVGEYPFIVFISDGNSLCGASLINTQWLVTAAHCDFTLATWYAYLGDHNIATSDGETRIKVMSRTVHPSYNAATFENDVAVLRLETAVTFTSRIQAIPLPGGQSVTTDDKAVVAGWGVLEEGGAVSNTLQHVMVCIQASNECSSLISSANEICAGIPTAPVRDSCRGDSGGPLVVIGTSGYYLAGIVSRGVGCRGRGVYMRVSAYESWINTAITMSG